MATIEFVNHAGFILHAGRVRLMCDPWLDGSAFDSGWDLLAATRFSYRDFHDVSHIWFSHEHPDHFSPPNLAQIPDTARGQIVVLYQRSIDQKVADYCRTLRFKRVIEITPSEWIPLDDTLEVLCEPHDNGDSWLAIRSPELTLLNINDCVVNSRRECRRMLEKVGRVDVLATQFSYANWVGNFGDREAMAAAARGKLEWMRTQISALTPKYVIPFASFMHFSHEDNCYLNEGMNRIDAVVEFVRRRTATEPVALYPGDRWNVRDEHLPDCEHALRRYAEDYDRVRCEGFRHRSSPVPVASLLEHGSTFADRLRETNGRLVDLLPSVAIYLDDHAEAVTLSPRGVRRASRARDTCDLATKSDALDSCLTSLWGARTLDINGRFQVPKGGRYWKFKTYATLASFNNRGEGLKEIVKTVYHRGRKRLG